MAVKKVEDLVVGDLVDLKTCPYLKEHPTAEFEFATVMAVDKETPECVSVEYEGIDQVGYPVGTELETSSKPSASLRP